MTRLLALALLFVSSSAFSGESVATTPLGWQISSVQSEGVESLVLRGPTSKGARRPMATIVPFEPKVAANQVLEALKSQDVKADLRGPQQIELQSGDRTVLQWILEDGFLLTVDADGETGRLKAAKTLVAWWQSAAAAPWRKRVGTQK